MAKDKRFPSDANKPKTGEKKSAAKAAPAAESAAKQQDLVQVEYKKENNHILAGGVHALAKGLNHVPKAIWEESKKHPSVAKLIADGHAVVVGDQSAAEAPAEADEDPSESDAAASADAESAAAGE